MEKVQEIPVTHFTSLCRPKLNLNLKPNFAGCVLAWLDTVTLYTR